MNIFAVNIRNFRSISDLWVFPNSDVNILVGPNNCGKSTVLKALQLLLDQTLNYRQQNVITRFDFYHGEITLPIEIVVWLKPTRKMQDNPDGSKSLRLSESDEIKGDFFDKLSEWIVVSEKRGDEYFHPVSLDPCIIEPMTPPDQIPSHEQLLAIKLFSSWETSEELANTEIFFIDQQKNELSALNSKQKEMLGFRLIETRRNPVYELSLSKRSILSRLIQEEEISLGLRELLEILDKSKNSVVNKPSIKNLFDRLSKIIAPELIGSAISGLGTEFSMTFLGSEAWKLRGATSIATTVVGAGQGQNVLLPLDYQGDGAQNLILLAHIIDLLRDEHTNNIIALEEPEQNLEPSLARWVFGQLFELTNRASGQLFISTHSPSLLQELQGAEALLIFYEHQSNSFPKKKDVLSGRCLPPDARKKLDQDVDFIDTLFSKMVLIVEGSSEVGFLPIAFRYFAGNSPFDDPYHLGLTIVNGDGKTKAITKARQLKFYKRKLHLLLDYDATDTDADSQSRVDRFQRDVDFVTCWPKSDLVPFVKGCDLEIILAANVPVEILFDAIKQVYMDAGHKLEKDNWEKALLGIDVIYKEKFPDVYGAFDLNSFKIRDLGDENNQRAFLFSLLHGPHECKSTKDMRLISKFLAEKKALPKLFDKLRIRLVESIRNPEKVDHEHPYLVNK